MSSRMRRPETVTLQITRGDWLVVKKHLTAGEQRAMFRHMMREMPNGDGDRIDSARVGLSRMITYLLDWSITDADDKPVLIRDQPDTVIAAALDALEVDSFTEILDAIDAHIASMEKERAKEKNGPATESVSSRTSSSRRRSAGVTTG